MSDERTVTQRIIEASKETLKECLVVAETKVNTKKGKDEDSGDYLKRISNSTEAKKKALKLAAELNALISKVSTETPEKANGEESNNRSEEEFITPENRTRG